MNKTSMNERIKMAFDGWAAQFENMPTWRPKIDVKDKVITIDGVALNEANEAVNGVKIDVTNITVFIEDVNTGEEKTVILNIEWADNAEPLVNILI